MDAIYLNALQYFIYISKNPADKKFGFLKLLITKVLGEPADNDKVN